MQPHDPTGGVGAYVMVFALVVFYLWYRERFAGRMSKRRLRALEIAQVDLMSGPEFETYVARLLDDRGFAVTTTPHTGDLGVDLVAWKHGDRIAVQCKRHSGTVSRSAVSDAVAGMQHYGCNSAMVVTNSWFTPGARTLAKSTGCALVDREDLAKWILEFQGKDA